MVLLHEREHRRLKSFAAMNGRTMNEVFRNGVWDIISTDGSLISSVGCDNNRPTNGPINETQEERL